MNNILFFDLEYDRHAKKIADIGGLLNGTTFHKKSMHEFERFAEAADYVCGHNIVDHDIPVLMEHGIDYRFHQKESIDTLYLSALLFAEKPYHSLIKDYGLFDGKVYHNDPLSDSNLAFRLFMDEVNAFYELSKDMQKIYYLLLRNRDGFKGFFKVIGYSCEDQNAGELIHRYFESRICRNAEIESIAINAPEECAYACALLNTQNRESVFPLWVSQKFPSIYGYLQKMRSRQCRDPHCEYCSNVLDPLKALPRIFGQEYIEFRKFDPKEKVPLQEQAVRHALEGLSLLAVFPTGGGKSLTFQLPAFMEGEAARALTVVISPLQSLMKDQVDNLKKRHDITGAVYINSTLSPLERKEALERAQDGDIHLLYIAPESLRSKTIENILKRRTITRFVIDEAHCFSSWGHDFRVDYLYIPEFIKNLQDIQQLPNPIPVSCFTATAKPQVIDDIIRVFSMKTGIVLKVFQSDLKRKNLNYQTIVCKDEDEKFTNLLSVLKRQKGSKIIYVSYTSEAEKLARKLQQNNYPALVYHGKLSNEAKTENMEKFLNDDCDTIVATSAFGMGVDKDNVEAVINYDITDSLENYIQETGRAGRDAAIKANCYLLFYPEDIEKHFTLFYNSRVNRKEIGQVWNGIKQLSEKRGRLTRSALEIAREAGWDTEVYELETKVKTSISVLEDTGFIKRLHNSPQVFADSFKVRDIAAISTIIQNAQSLSNDYKNYASQIVQRIIKDDETRVDYLADILGMPRDTVTTVLNILKDLDIIGDNKDLSAFVNSGKSSKNSLAVFKKMLALERRLLAAIENRPLRISLKEINTKLQENGIGESTIDHLRCVLNYWEIKKYIKKKRIDRIAYIYTVEYLSEPASIKDVAIRTQELAHHILNYLMEKHSGDMAGDKAKPESAVEFSIVELKKAIERQNALFETGSNINDYQNALLYLNSISAITLDKGFLVLYNPMEIHKIEDNKRKFTNDDYEKLRTYYEHKIEQMHIVLEYAKKMIDDHRGAMEFVDDYFTIPFSVFMNKYFKGRKGEIKQPVSPEKFKRIFGELTPEQLKIIRDGDSRHILVAAGPGSGKTRVLVHKIASLLIMEDVKPEQFLMLTFSRSASIEFRSRLRNLIGNIALYIDIFTYHSYCFNLHGTIGTIEKSDNIISSTIDDIRNGEIPREKIAHKSVLVIDEFQDVNKEEYQLIKEVIAVAEDIRVITVGDDDQNIYEFRGASVEFMKEYGEEYQAAVYELLKNFRSVKNIVEFSNQFVKKIDNRLKTSVIDPYKKQTGHVEITKYSTGHIIIPLVEKVKAMRLSGSTAILTSTNEEASLVEACLRHENIPARLIFSTDSFKIRDIQEIDYFTEHIKKHAGTLGIYPKKQWQSIKNAMQEKYADSARLRLALAIIDKFELNYKYYANIEWMTYIDEVRIEDFINQDEKTILISTMHKAKGKEFDNVFVLLNNYRADYDEAKRVVYVAITRAKENLFIITNTRIFDDISIKDINVNRDDRAYQEPVNISLYSGHKDVVLNHYKSPPVINHLDKCVAGAKLAYSGNGWLLCNESRIKLVKFSKKFQETFDMWAQKGYVFENAEINYIVKWFDKEDEKKYSIVLPRIDLVRSVT